MLNSSSKFRVVLVSPLFEGNVGAVARACANFDVDELYFVNPKCDVYSETAKMYACGNSIKTLINSRVNLSLADAISDCHVAVAFTRRKGTLRQKPLELANIVQLSEKSESVDSRVALVFGREDDGLSDADVELCTHVTSFNTSSNMPSMNLSHAVAVVLASLYKESPPADLRIPKDANSGISDNSVKIEQLEAFFLRLQTVAEKAGLTAQGNPQRLLSILRPLVQKGQPTHREMDAFHGFLSAIEKKLI